MNYPRSVTVLFPLESGLAGHNSNRQNPQQKSWGKERISGLKL